MSVAREHRDQLDVGRRASRTPSSRASARAHQDAAQRQGAWIKEQQIDIENGNDHALPREHAGHLRPRRRASRPTQPAFSARRWRSAS